MKTLMLLLIICSLILFSCSSSVSSRTEVKYDSKLTKEDTLALKRDYEQNHYDPYNIEKPEKYPEPIGGMEEIAEKLYYTREAKINNIEGRVLLLFTVTELGNVEDVSVLKGLGYGLDEIAVKAIKDTKFKPGEANGSKINVKTVLPLQFKLE